MPPLEKEPKINSWISMAKEAGCTIGRIEPISILRKKNGELLFALLNAEVGSPEGRRLPEYIFIRGDACLIVAQLRNSKTGEKHYLMIRQYRIGNGSLSLEFPAGMLDDLVDDPLGVAVREFEEETGIKISPSELFPLHDRKLFSSAGASDEGIFYFGCRKEVDDSTWRSLAGKIRGNAAEGEYISVVLISKDDALKEATSLQVFLGFYLFEAHSGG